MDNTYASIVMSGVVSASGASSSLQSVNRRSKDKNTKVASKEKFML